MLGPEVLIFMIPIVAILAWAITRVSGNFFDYLERSRGPVKDQASLTTSELHGLIAEAVTDATTELEARVERLERQLQATRQRPLLDEADEDPQFLASSGDEQSTPERKVR